MDFCEYTGLSQKQSDKLRSLSSQLTSWAEDQRASLATLKDFLTEATVGNDDGGAVIISIVPLVWGGERERERG